MKSIKIKRPEGKLVKAKYRKLLDDSLSEAFQHLGMNGSLEVFVIDGHIVEIVIKRAERINLT